MFSVIILRLFRIKSRQIKLFSDKNSCFYIIVRIWLGTWIEEDSHKKINESTRASENSCTLVDFIIH